MPRPMCGGRGAAVRGAGGPSAEGPLREGPAHGAGKGPGIGLINNTEVRKVKISKKRRNLKKTYAL